MTAHWTNSWLNLHWQQETVHSIQRKEKHIVWTEVYTKGMMIPTSKKKCCNTKQMQREGRFYKYEWFSHQSNIAKARVVAKWKTRRSSNIDITMMSSNENEKHRQRRLSLPNQTNHCWIPWESQPKNQSRAKAMWPASNKSNKSNNQLNGAWPISLTGESCDAGGLLVLYDRLADPSDC